MKIKSILLTSFLFFISFISYSQSTSWVLSVNLKATTYQFITYNDKVLAATAANARGREVSLNDGEKPSTASGRENRQDGMSRRHDFSIQKEGLFYRQKHYFKEEEPCRVPIATSCQDISGISRIAAIKKNFCFGSQRIEDVGHTGCSRPGSALG